MLEDAAATSIPVLTNDTDPDGGPKTISSATDPANGTVVLTGGSPGAHTGLTYQPDPNYCNDPPGTTPDTFNYTRQRRLDREVSMTVTCVNDAPVADNETFGGAGTNDQAHGNTTMQVDDPTDNKAAPTNPHTEITGDILDGDTDVDGPGPADRHGRQRRGRDQRSDRRRRHRHDRVRRRLRLPAARDVSCDNGTDFFNYKIADQAARARARSRAPRSGP